MVETPATPASSPTGEQPPNNLNFTNMISHFIRNTGSYFMTKSSSSGNSLRFTFTYYISIGALIRTFHTKSLIFTLEFLSR